MKMRSFDVIIVGGGIAGLATAYFFAQKNPEKKLLLLEKEPALGLHASGRNAALFRQAIEHEQGVAWVQDSLRFLSRPPTHWREEMLQKTGSVLVGTQDSIQEFHQRLRKAGAVSRVHLPGEVPSSCSPWLAQQLEKLSYEALLHCPEDGVLRVSALLEQLRQDLLAVSVEFRFGEAVQALRRVDGTWFAETSLGIYRAEQVVNAAGAWVLDVAAQAGLKALPEIVALKRHLFVTEPSSLSETGPYFWDVANEYYFREEQGGFLLSAGDETEQLAGEAMVDPEMEGRWRGKFRDFCFGDVAALAQRRAWACLRTKRRGGGFYVRRDEGEPSFVWVAALGGHGMSAGLGVGRFAAELLELGR